MLLLGRAHAAVAQRVIASCSGTPWWTMTVLGSHTMYAGLLPVEPAWSAVARLRSPLAFLPPRGTQLCKSYREASSALHEIIVLLRSFVEQACTNLASFSIQQLH